MKHRPRVFSGREGDEILAATYLGLARLTQPEGRLQGCRLGLPGGSSALGGSGGLSADGTRLRAPTLWVLLFVPFYPIQPITKAVIGKCAGRGLCQVNTGRPRLCLGVWFWNIVHESKLCKLSFILLYWGAC